MFTAHSDRNLLLGVLALQMDFVSRDALIRAMNAWAVDKAKSLGQIFVEQQALSADRRALLEALVEEHLKLHDNDPSKSLAAVGSIGTAREELRQVSDPDVQATLNTLSAGRNPPEDPCATRDSPVTMPTA